VPAAGLIDRRRSARAGAGAPHDRQQAAGDGHDCHHLRDAPPKGGRLRATTSGKQSCWALWNACARKLIKNRLFYAFNILYEPEGTITGINPTAWDPESTFGVSSALAFQVIPNVVIGADLWYLRHYEGTTLNSFTGDAVYLGPTFYWKISPKTLISASWEAQIAGREIGGPSPLNLADFSRQRARIVMEFEF
jgi:hypothetical protein